MNSPPSHLWNAPFSADKALERRLQLEALLSVRIEPAQLASQLSPGTVVVIPVGESDDRDECLRVSLSSLECQPYEHAVRVVIADNGMTPSQHDALAEIRRHSRLDIDVVDARPMGGHQRNAAYGRNQAIRYTVARAKTEPAYRLDNLLLLDDDVALLPGGLAALDSVRRQRNAVAVCSTYEPVRSLDEGVWRHHAERWAAAAPAPAESPLPSLVEKGVAQMAPVVAFFGDVGTKTACLMLDMATVSRIVEQAGDLFFYAPFGTNEDVVLSLTLARLGTSWRCPSARALDRERPSGDALVRQRTAYSRDRSILFGDLVHLGWVPPGIQILEPDGQGWTQWSIPHPTAVALVAPQSMACTAQELASAIRDDRLLGAFREQGCLEKMYAGLYFLQTLLNQVDSSRPSATRHARCDYPGLMESRDDMPRFSQTSWLAQLGGYILGNIDSQPASWPGGVTSAVFGCRHQVAW